MYDILLSAIEKSKDAKQEDAKITLTDQYEKFLKDFKKFNEKFDQKSNQTRETEDEFGRQYKI